MSPLTALDNFDRDRLDADDVDTQLRSEDPVFMLSSSNQRVLSHLASFVTAETCQVADL